MPPYLILDVETCPLNLVGYDALTDSEKSKLLNPIDSRIVAIGARHDGIDTVWCEDDERIMLDNFWRFFENYPKAKLVGFAIKDFDIPFLITRSFVNNVKIVPFVVNDTVLDIREKFTAYSYTSRARGKLKEYGEIVGITDNGMSGKDVAGLCITKQRQSLIDYLKRDLLITDEVFKRACELGIAYLERW